MKERFDKNVSEIEFKEGQRVLWADPERLRGRSKATSKSARSWFGPYTIERIKNRLLVKLRKVKDLIRSTRLKPYYEANPDAAGIPQRADLKRGVRVAVYWEGDKTVYEGTLGRFDERRGMWQVEYDDGETLFELEEHIALEGEDFTE